MKLRHASALALVGWYLMMPPDYPPSDAPTNWHSDAKLATWINVAAYDSAARCNNAKVEVVGATGRIGKAMPRDRREVLRAENAQCIASDDPLSLPKISYEPECEQLREFAIELTRSNETGCDPNHNRLSPDRDRKTLRA